MSAELKFDMVDFNQKTRQVRDLLHRNAGSYIRTTARRLIKRLSWNVPHAPPYFQSAGRLRAGFWPAAAALGITNIYTQHPNKGEGSAVDATRSTGNPMFTIRNSVPYITRLKAGQGWVEDAKRGVEAQMARDLRKYVEDSWARRELIENLTGD